MKNRSTRKNKTRNFRKTNRGGGIKTRSMTANDKATAIKSTAMSDVSNMVVKAKDTSSRTNHRINLNRMSRQSRPIRAGDENKVYMMGFWGENWTRTLREVINKDLFVHMTLEKDENNEKYKKQSEKNLLLYKIYEQALKIRYRSSERDDAKKNIIPLIDRFITLYANDYTGPKLNTLPPLP